MKCEDSRRAKNGRKMVCGKMAVAEIVVYDIDGSPIKIALCPNHANQFFWGKTPAARTYFEQEQPSCAMKVWFLPKSSRKGGTT